MRSRLHAEVFGFIREVESNDELIAMSPHIITVARKIDGTANTLEKGGGINPECRGAKIVLAVRLALGTGIILNLAFVIRRIAKAWSEKGRLYTASEIMDGSIA